MDLTPKRAAIKMHYERCGVNYEENRHFIDKEGFISAEILNRLISPETINRKFDLKTDAAEFNARPKSLENISNNNGWYCIEAGETPFISGHYDVLAGGNIIYNAFYADTQFEKANKPILSATHWRNTNDKKPLY